MTVEELLVRSAMAYGEADAYADRGVITIVQPSRRNEYAFTTTWAREGDFSYVVHGPASSRFAQFEIHKAGARFETIRGGTYGQASTLEVAIAPFQDIMTVFTTNVPRLLAGDNWGPTNDYEKASIVGVTSMNGQPTIMIELDLIEQGPASIWLDQATLMIRRLAHQSPRSETFVTVTFNQLDAR